MRAAAHFRYGPPEVLRIIELPTPTPGPGEILVRVHATTVNRTDCAYRAARPFFMRGLTGLRTPRRPVTGTEFAGRVAATGDPTGPFAVGERVLGYCEGRFGAHAEYVVVAADGLVRRIPTGIDWLHAAAATEGWHYARSAIRRAGVRAGQEVLVNGATGGIGSAAVQLLHAKGATVTAVCAAEHHDLVRRLGADRVVDRRTGDFTATGRRYDLVLDAVGKSTFGRCRPILTEDGVYVSSELGPGWQNLPLAAWGGLRHGHRRVVFPYPDEDPRSLDELTDQLASGAFRPVIERTYPFEDIVAAHRHVETGEKIGNVVITVHDDA